MPGGVYYAETFVTLNQPTEMLVWAGRALRIWVDDAQVLAHDVRDWGTPESRRHALLTTVQAFIQQNLGDSGLTPAAIAAAHHISLRSLHQLFHDEGLTVAGWIRQRRLERCRRDLADPALAARPVAAIAARWGYPSAAEFSRAFRAAHGVPPAEYRRSARDANASAR